MVPSKGLELAGVHLRRLDSRMAKLGLDLHRSLGPHQVMGVLRLALSRVAFSVQTRGRWWEPLDWCSEP